MSGRSSSLTRHLILKVLIKLDRQILVKINHTL